MKNKLKYILFIIFIILSIIGTIYIVTLESAKVENIYTSEMLVYLDGVEYEIKVNNQTKETIFREGDIEEVIFRYPRTGKPRISIPNLDKIQGQDMISNLKTFVDYTYNLCFQDSCKYLKYLLDTGYSMKMYAVNSQYLECFLEKEKVIKRLIIFSDSLMVCNLADGVEIPKVYEYFKEYNYNGFIENKFNTSFEDE